MKIFLILSLSLISLQSYAAAVTKELLSEEIQLAIRLSDKYEVPLEVTGGVCTKTKFEIVSRVTGFNPASWTLASGENSFRLSSDEIQGMISIVNRIEAPLTVLDSITTETRVTIEGASCGFNPNYWTVSFDDQE